MPARNPRVERAVIGAFAAVVLSFTAASWFGQYRAGEIERAALSIQSNAAPSIRRLASARAELRGLQLLVHRALDEDAPARRIVEIDTGRALLDEQIREYQRLPRYPGEDAVWRAAESALSRMDGDLGAIVADLRRGDVSAARERQDHLDDSSEALANALSHAIDVNVTAASRLAAAIQETRRRALLWTALLDVAGALLAGMAAALSLRVSRAHSRAVQDYRDVAERRADELEQFAARLAHDVRTPLSAVGLSLGLAARHGGDDPRFRRAIDRAHQAFQRTTGVIDALFEFARAGARPRPGARASVVEAAQAAADVMLERAEQIAADIVVEGDPALAVACASGVLEVAFANLVGNALTVLEGAPARRVIIKVDRDGDEVRAVVADTGPGLPAGVSGASLFEPYVRGPRARGTGLGLGLATVQRIVDAHGGRVGVRSSPSGCAFWLALPAA